MSVVTRCLRKNAGDGEWEYLSAGWISIFDTRACKGRQAVTSMPS